MDHPLIAHHIALLKNKDTNVRRTAAEVLAEIGDSTAVSALIGALNDRKPEVGYYCPTPKNVVLQ
jgi:HEAT repeat protein